ncbi:MAG: anti-sigma factor [Acidobacteriaceae bacterium]
MTPDIHPDPEELILYCMARPDAGTPDAAAVDRVRLHLQGCAQCRAEVAQLRTELALTAMAAPTVLPPPGSKARLFQAAGLDLAKLDAEKASTVATPPPQVVPLRPRRSNAGLLWGGWLVAAACLLYAFSIHQANERMRHQLSQETAQLVQSTDSAARAHQVLDLLSSPQAQRVTLVAAHTTPVPTGHAVYLPSRGALVFTASNMAPLPPNKTYELWVIPANGAAPVPAGTFQPDARGMASVLLPNLPHDVEAKAFGVTMENTGGATTPTMPILLAGG